jgi:hypothetical protein
MAPHHLSARCVSLTRVETSKRSIQEEEPRQAGVEALKVVDRWSWDRHSLIVVRDSGVTYPLRRLSACNPGRSTRKYLRTNSPSRPCNGAPQLRQVISRSASAGSRVTRTTLY